MSGKLKAKPREQSTKAQRSWLSNVLGIKMPWDDDDEPEVETPEVEPTDPRAVKAANDLINVHGEAVKLGFDLGGQRDTLKTQVQQQILDKQYDDAQEGIKTLRDLLDQAKQAREKWLAAAATLGTVEKQVALLETAKTTDAATHKEALAKVKDLATKLDFAEALKQLEKLAPLVEKAAKNGQAKIDYEAERGKLSDDEAAVMRIKDTPGNLKTLKDTFIATKTKTEESVGKNEYEAALTSLTKLKQDLKAALGAKRTALEQDTKLKVQGIKGKLSATTTNGKKAWADIGSPEWKGAVDDILKVQLDEDFTARYDKVCDTVADNLAKDEDVKEAFKDWKKWTKDPQALIANKAKIEKAMKQVLKIQSEALGLPPTAVETYSNPSEPGDCGGWSGSDNRININLNSADFGDFKELLDTLTHENTHAYQEKLIKDFRAGNIPEGDPNYNAAMVLEMNDSAGYVSPSESKEFRKLDNSKNPYMDQVCEKHAWRAGRMAGQAAFNKLSGI